MNSSIRSITGRSLNILAIETSGVFCSAALLLDDAMLARHEEAPRRHGERLLPMLAELLAEADRPLSTLDAIVFGRGPGSFTGVRIAAAVAQGAALGADLPVLGLSTLAGLAHGAWQQHGRTSILTAIDARIGEVYWGLFQVDPQGGVIGLSPERVSAPEQVRIAVPAFGAGNAWSLHREALIHATGIEPQQSDGQINCTAADLARLAPIALNAGAAQAPEASLPVYVRDRVAVKPASSVKND